MNTENKTDVPEVDSSDLFAELIDKWDNKIRHLKTNAAGQHAIPKSRINAEIKGIRLCKKQLKELIANDHE